MFDTARFQIIGRVGKIKTFEKVVRVSIATNASYKDNGEWVDRTIWNEVAIFDKSTRAYVDKKLAPGDYVRAEGVVRQNTFERGDETVYTVDLAVDSFSRQPKKAAKEEADA